MLHFLLFLHDISVVSLKVQEYLDCLLSVLLQFELSSIISLSISVTGVITLPLVCIAEEETSIHYCWLKVFGLPQSSSFGSFVMLGMHARVRVVILLGFN